MPTTELIHAIATRPVDDDRLRQLARDLRLCDGGIDDKDPPLHDPNWTTGWKVKTMCRLIPHLYSTAVSKRPSLSRSSYGLKHDLEHLFQTYAPALSSVHTNWVGNGELILAMAYCGYEPSSVSAPNAYYHLKDARKGKTNKGGKAKKEADETEALVRDVLAELQKTDLKTTTA
jgi:hypothetical protein